MTSQLQKCLQKLFLFTLVFWSSTQTVSLADSPRLQPATSPEDRWEAWQSHQRMLSSSKCRQLNWQLAGPRMQGGRIEAIACPAGHPSTTYRGDSWTRMSPDLAKGDLIPNLCYKAMTTLSEQTQQVGVLIAGTDNGNLHLTRDNGKCWSDIADGSYL